MKRLVTAVLVIASVVASSWRATTIAQQQQSGPSGAINGPLRLSVDTPVPGQTLTVPFAIGGWTIDQFAVSGTGIDAVHIYAFPVSGAPIFIGLATMGISRPDVGAVFGAQFTPSGFNAMGGVPLAPGIYTLTFYGHRVSNNTFS